MTSSPSDRAPRDRDRDRKRHRREREAYRFVEVPPSVRLTVLEGLATVSGALLVGTVLGFLVLLGVTLMGGELVQGGRHEAEEVMRTSLGWWVLTLAVTAVAFVPLRAAATFVTAAALVGEGRPSTDVPPRSVRRRVAESNPPGALAGLAWTLLVLAVVAGGAVAPFAMNAQDSERVPVVVVSAVVGAAATVGLAALRGLRARWEATRERVRTTWGTNEVRFAEAAEGRRRAALGPQPAASGDTRRPARNGRAAAVLGGTGLVGFVLFMVGATMRHPRKYGPDEYYGPVGETSIDVLVGVGGVLVGGALLVGAAWLLLPGSRRERRAALDLLRSPAGSAPPPDDVVRELLSPWSPPVSLALAWLVGAGLVAPSVLAGLAGAGAALLVDGVPFALVALALLVSAAGAAVVVVLDVPRSARRRAQVRERWHVGDDGAA
ncbi:hypothetical protein H1Q78_18855 [Cellulosimicrobium cellulans]|uniref:hypothetical protein n=1 Tax=Cellulosimicrobium cellulans TaxID=1710 RepID=UPI001EDB7F48|nr:hypothetical protein [Cellulosimicrobium cellulans]UKJ63643.1 hypothetical protein H1Q78_18855 [Cellulosimicrobium cellulans]